MNANTAMNALQFPEVFASLALGLSLILLTLSHISK